ncbi:MAG: hypothetical protein WKG00_05830 [Polyangiaceae bacterium]
MRRGPLLLAVSLATATATAAPLVAADGPRRPAPDYDGRPEPDASGGEVLLWVPRIVVYPIYLLSEYVLRGGVGMGMRRLEQLRADSEEQDTFGFTPALELETDRRPVFGLMAIWREVGDKRHTLRGYAGFGGTDWLRAILGSRVDLDEGAEVTMRAEASRRPDGIFWGIGPLSLEGDAARYGRDLFDGGFAARVPAASHLRLSFDAGLRRDHFDAPACCDEPSVVGRVARGEMAAPPGFDGFTRLHQGLGFDLDSRDEPGARATGLALHGGASHAIDVESPRLDRWVRWGGRLHGEVDVTGTERMLGLSLQARFADPLGGGEVPFVELASLGGDDMRGFAEGRLLGRSATVATLGWRWPLWPYFEGRTHVACGTVAGAHLDGWRAGDLRLSFDFGLHTEFPSPSDWELELMVGVGSERFDDGGRPETARVLFAVTPRF